jgi:sugar phosphate isomerase/epimerase
MRVALHNWMRVESLEVTVARMAAYGYDAIEISGEPERYDTKHVRKLLKDHGVACWGAVTLMLGARNLVAGSGRQRAMTVKYIKDTITMAKELGGEVVAVVPGTIGKLTPDGSAEEEWNWAIDGFTQCYEHGLQEGVRLAIEPINRFETYFLNRHDQALALASAVGPECGICLDCFHMNIEEPDLLQAIRNARGRLNDFHVSDNTRMACGMGMLDWKRIIATLKEIRYTGAMTVELVAAVDRTPVNPYPNMLDTRDVPLTPEEQKFMADHATGDLSNEFYSWLVGETIKTLRRSM